jgi:hypothetical protein
MSTSSTLTGVARALLIVETQLLCCQPMDLKDRKGLGSKRARNAEVAIGWSSHRVTGQTPLSATDKAIVEGWM